MNFKTQNFFKNVFRKKSKEEKLMSLRVQLGMLIKDLSNLIFEDELKVKYARSSNKADLRAERRIKDAYNALFVLDRAQEDLENVNSDEQLASIVKRTSHVLAKLNMKAEGTKKIGGQFYKWQAEEIDERIVKEPSQKLDVKYEDVNVSEDIVERLLKGQGLDQCIQEDRIRLENQPTDYIPPLASDGNSVEENYQQILNNLQNEV